MNRYKPKLILNAGIYDLCHRGHLNLLRKMKEMAGEDGKVVIVLHDDDSTFKIKDKIPIQNLAQRSQNLYLTRCVDEIEYCFNPDPSNTFYLVVSEAREDNYDIHYVRGDDKVDDFPGKTRLDKLGIPITYLPYTKGISSSEIKKELLSLD